ncbi:UbiH/UbiF/VisC/COQ6 family ubiquinone biosynthesis hydroxylase [Sabulicella glaciei]|uniref:UbiH/UbiF/VisC/COQ6 family ubiquinone biosynthesis hydroxylase n=1 Tax=Sabulicella glaciei TaxID=2984948 RepID=A0ABT3P0T5_9PROT|nr:UbiH/UbiF/VisC/COQ6 family ubiquinone biosynthesis hydroxylase [Roseococcus sp. MDT2-1-1]MCW8088006.1 UbiH/UbiF/VisC/COQ6 family ubiquinone biosynthesis hydroxylase [Roseococcus sp. MDT2-1-1]
MSSEIECPVAIVGAGPVGATLAAALAARGVPCAVVDAQPLPPMEVAGFDGRAYAIALASRRVLEEAGVWARLPIEPCPIEAIKVADGRVGEAPSSLDLDFDAFEVGSEPFGWMVEARALRVALNAHLPGLPGVRVFAPMTARAERREGGATLSLADGTVIRAQLVVGAEGRRSALREEARIRVMRHDYGQVGLVGAFAHEHPHRNRALELFLPAGPFAQLPLTDLGSFGTSTLPHASAFVWTERRAVAERVLQLDDAGFARELRRRLGDWLGVIEPIGRRWHYPLTAMHATRYVAQRLALVGDAAHGMHPIAGQGLNIGFRDVGALARLVGEAHARGQDVGRPALLARYQAERRPDALMMIGATHALERLFGNDVGVLRLARRLGIAAVDRVGPLKRFFARRAMGV